MTNTQSHGIHFAFIGDKMQFDYFCTKWFSKYVCVKSDRTSFERYSK